MSHVYRYPKPSVNNVNGKIQLSYTLTQQQIDYFDDPARYKVMAKGRRFGGTISGALYNIDMLWSNPGLRALWIDVIYSNINRYYTRYFLPVLKLLPKGSWEWRAQDKILTIGDSYLDMRSADKPESIEGQGYDLITMNEAGLILQNPLLWTVSVAPMALDGNATCLFIGTPKGRTNKKLNEEHLYFTFYKNGLAVDKGGNAKPGWKSWCYTSYDNPAYSKESVDELANQIPAAERRQEIFAEFVDITADAIFKPQWFEVVDKLPEDFTIIRKVIAMDTAYETKATSDYSAAVVVYQTANAYYIVDCVNEKYEFPDLLRATQDLYDKWPADLVIIEGKASGKSLIQSLKVNSTMPVKETQPGRDKVTRANAITPTCERRVVKLLRGAWNNMLLNQLLNFPCGHDDMVDALTTALTELKDYRGMSAPVVTAVDRLHTRNPELRGYNRTFNLQPHAQPISKKNYLT